MRKNAIRMYLSLAVSTFAYFSCYNEESVNFSEEEFVNVIVGSWSGSYDLNGSANSPFGLEIGVASSGSLGLITQACACVPITSVKIIGRFSDATLENLTGHGEFSNEGTVLRIGLFEMVDANNLRWAAEFQIRNPIEIHGVISKEETIVGHFAMMKSESVK